MRRPLRSEAGFTLVELTIVVVISTIALIAVYQTLITQERTYRYQSAAIDAQGTTRVGLQMLASELREISASAGATPLTTGGSDLLMARSDSIRFRAFRKAGMVCAIDVLGGSVDVWVLGNEFEEGDTLFMFQEGDTITDEDDTWATGIHLRGVGAAANEDACASEWAGYDLQSLAGLSPLTLATVSRGALVRSYETMSYGIFSYDGDWVLGRRMTDGTIIPLVGPLMAPATNGGLRFRYYNANGVELTPTTAAIRAQVARVSITVRALSQGGIDGAYVDSLSTNVYLRGN